MIKNGPKVRTKWDSIDGERLIRAFRLAETPNILRLFLDDLLTEKELNLFIRRLQAAYLLSLGTPYSFVKISTGLSQTTIARISKQLRDKRAGYNEILIRLNPNGFRYFD